jgi:chromosome segregation ATPase
MEIMLVFLSTAIGTVAGVIVAALMMQRKIRVAGAGVDLALKTQLQNTEWALASAGRDVEDLRNQLELREQAVQQGHEELEKAQQQLAAAVANAEKEAVARAEAEQRTQNLEAQATDQQRSTDEETGRKLSTLETELADSRRQVEDLTAQLNALTDQFAERQRSTEEETSRQVAALQTEVAESRREVEDLTAQLAALTDRFADQKRSTEEESDRQIVALETEIVNGRRQIADLTAQLAALGERQRSTDEETGRQIADLAAQLADQQRINEEAEALLSAERASARHLAAQVEELTGERGSLEAQLQKERQSAAEGMQLLLLAQTKLSGAPQNGGNGTVAAHLVEAV